MVFKLPQRLRRIFSSGSNNDTPEVMPPPIGIGAMTKADPGRTENNFQLFTSLVRRNLPAFTTALNEWSQKYSGQQPRMQRIDGTIEHLLHLAVTLHEPNCSFQDLSMRPFINLMINTGIRDDPYIDTQGVVISADHLARIQGKHEISNLIAVHHGEETPAAAMARGCTVKEITHAPDIFQGL